MQRSLMRWVCLLAVLVLVVAACSSGSSSKKKTTTKPNPCAATGTSKQKLAVTPCQALTDGQTVKVVVSGFTAGKNDVGINECSDKTNDTGSGCDLRAIKPLPIDTKGGGSVDFTVKKGGFGQDNVKCGAPDQCLISVGELVAAANAERTDTVNISFSG